MNLTDEAGKRAAEGWQALLEAHLGPAGATLVWTVIWIAGLALLLVFKRYVGVLGAGEGTLGSPERQAYENLRASLSDGGSPTRIYGRLLTTVLDHVDQFLGDHDKAHLGIFRRAFGLRGTYSLWTAAAFDRCLLLALFYPIATVLSIWAISGHVGPAEDAFHLRTGVSGWRRGVFVGGVTYCTFSIIGLLDGPFRKVVVRVAMSVCVGIAVIVTFDDTPTNFAITAAAPFFSVALAHIIVDCVHLADSGIIVVTVSILVLLVLAAVRAFASANASTGAAAAAIGVVILFTLVLILIVGRKLIMFAQRRHHGAFIAGLVGMMVTLIICLARWLPPTPMWDVTGPVLLFLGLLTLLNAPFDWLSLGLTRALLRRGVELRGWWPYGLALVDAALAVIISVVLAGTIVIGIQAFDLAATNDGGSPVLPLGPLFDGVAAHPGDPVNWWVYALLLSTLIPSLINLLIGAGSLTRGVPGVSTLLLRFMPLGAAVLAWDRAWIAAVLTAQWAIGGILMLAAFALLGWLVATTVPEVGTWFLDYARWVADLDLPRHALGMIGH